MRAFILSGNIMQLTLKAFEVEALGGSLNAVCQQTDLPFKISYWAARNLTKIKFDLEQFANERRKIFEANGTLSADGQRYDFAPEKLDEVNKALKDMGDVDVSCNLMKIKLTTLENCDKLTGAMLGALIPLIDETPEELS